MILQCMQMAEDPTGAARPLADPLLPLRQLPPRVVPRLCGDARLSGGDDAIRKHGPDAVGKLQTRDQSGSTALEAAGAFAQRGHARRDRGT